MTSPTQRRIRCRWGVLAVVLWLVLASSITLELGQQAIAQWGSAAALSVLGFVILLAAGRTAFIPMRGAWRGMYRWAKGRFR
jgi:hypothetical protein